MYRWIPAALAAVFLIPIANAPAHDGAQDISADRPNIVWIIIEDMSADFSCYGQDDIETPHIDALAAGGTRFTDAVVTAPVCSTSRSALVTGMYQTTIGAQHHRSGRGDEKIELPDNVRLVPHLFRHAGYLTLNLTFQDFVKSDRQVAETPRVGVAKTDYNFEWDEEATYDRLHWAARADGVPFFAQVQLRGGKLRGLGNSERWPARVEQTLGNRTSADEVSLPPYLPEDPVIREDWAQYLDSVRYTDWEVGEIVKRLYEAGELDRTVLFLITDHGVSHVRNKQFCYEGGMHIPMIVHGPGIEVGRVREDVVEHIDLAASSLTLAGIPRPDSMQARDILGADVEAREYVFSARDRCDETVDHMRAVRSTRYKYIRNFLPGRPYLQPNAYKDNKPILQAMRRLHAAGGLSDAQARIMAEMRPPEELYDLQQDPYELHNLADSPEHAPVLAAMRGALDHWMQQTDDRGRWPEPEAMYDSDMAVYLNGLSRRAPERLATIEANIAWMKQQAAEEAADEDGSDD